MSNDLTDLFAKKMQEAADLCDRDQEDGHIRADKVLVWMIRELTNGEDSGGCDIFEKMPKWYA